ncbi:lipid-A-disaccharide synthase [Prevotella sp. FD3004]|uniref:lipid-A-disaccharide synthase n=1 Tax=Prevotella sp. FD3004 TaxID=1408309 RepID=UPI00056C4C5D|nr:lipid-A-disaccharide synthase [Prevotella sp. FD3004]
MRYYLIAGEASGDLHASYLMRSLKEIDNEAEFRFFGGDLMTAVGGTRVRHYSELAYMGFIPVLLHLPTILGNMKMCKHDITEWHPDCVILVDYPGFNLKIAKYVKSHTNIPVYYYISPKIWAWKEYRIKNIKRDVDELFSILPFEVPFFEVKHHYPIHYVGNPTADEVRTYLAEHNNGEHGDKKIIALLAGSRQQEIKDNLPAMLESVKILKDSYRVVLAGAPGIDSAYYERFVKDSGVEIVYNQTYDLLSKAHAALVTSGTATLEAALFNVPQVVCYKTPIPKVISFLRKHLLKVKYISLVNLIANREVVRELVADTFSVSNIQRELQSILTGPDREAILKGYEEVHRRLGDQKAPDNAAHIIYKLNHNQSV